RIATGVCKRTHKSLADHIVGETENWNVPGRPLSGTNCGISACQDDINARLYQFGRMLLELLGRQSVPGLIDHKVLPDDEAEPLELVKERDVMRRIAWTGMHGAEAINPSGRLRVRAARPWRGGGEEREDFTAVHSHHLSTFLSCRPPASGGPSN